MARSIEQIEQSLRRQKRRLASRRDRDYARISVTVCGRVLPNNPAMVNLAGVVARAIGNLGVDDVTRALDSLAVPAAAEVPARAVPLPAGAMFPPPRRQAKR